jgi:hypothetical protein
VSVHFDVDLVPGKLAALQAAAGGLEAKFKLNSKISTGVYGVAAVFNLHFGMLLICAWEKACHICLTSSSNHCCCNSMLVLKHLCDPVLCMHCCCAGNMMLFDAEGHIKRYDSPEDILREFFDLRLQFYERRRVGLLQVRPG